MGTVVYDFEGTDDEELSVHEGDTVRIIKEFNVEWLFVESSSGNTGFVPTTYVKNRIPEGAFPIFQLSFDGVVQDYYFMHNAEEWYNFSVPVEYLFDGILNINVHSLAGFPEFIDANLYGTVLMKKNIVSL